MAEINWTDEAEHWLEEVYNYIALENPEAAFKTVDNIYEQAQILIKFPSIGYRYTKIEDREVRILLYGHYRIGYLIKEDKNIDILGVFHGALDIERLLK